MQHENPIEWQKALMQQEGLDVLISSSPDNVAYTIGFPVPSQQLGLRKRQFAAVVTPVGRDVFLAVRAEVKQAREHARIQDVRTYNEFTETFSHVLADIIKELGAERGRIGIELDFFPVRSFTELVKALPNAQIEDAEALFDRLRMVKTREEIEILKRIGSIVDRAHIEASEMAKPGWTEVEFGSAIRESVLSQGGENIRLVVGSGHRSTWSNCPPTAKRLEVGENIKVDVFAQINGYFSDIARTVVVGNPSDYQREIWNRLVDIHSSVLEMIKPGANTGDIWKKYVEQSERRGVEPAINFLGHGLGLTLHEEPYINPYSDRVLEENMVLAIEEVIHPQGVGFHLEDEVIVTSNGYELISDGRGEMLAIR